MLDPSQPFSTRICAGGSSSSSNNYLLPRGHNVWPLTLIVIIALKPSRLWRRVPSKH